MAGNITLIFSKDDRTSSDRARSKEILEAIKTIQDEIEAVANYEFAGISGDPLDNTELATDLNSKSNVGHIHDSRYYTETEIDTLLQSYYTQGQIDGFLGELTNAVTLEGQWDASSGLFPGGGTAQIGHAYQVSVDGIVDGVDFSAGDRILAVTNNASTTTYSTNWLKLDYTDLVESVAGLTGTITVGALLSALSLNNVDNTSDANKPVSTAQQSALDTKEGTLNADQKRKITYGTADPIGGSDGDIYLQHD